MKAIITAHRSIFLVSIPLLFLGHGSAAAQEAGDPDEIAEIHLGEYEEVESDDFDDANIDDSSHVTAAGSVESPQQELERYYLLYRDAMDNKAYEEADTLAKRVVELAIQLYGVNSLDSARALTNLGLAQHFNEDYEAAELNYTAAIEVIERVEDRLNENLVNPLKGLGAAQLASGRPDQATKTFRRAVHISHVNEGPHNLMQVGLLESLAETYMSVGEIDQVENVNESIFLLEARDVDLESLEIIPALEKQAMWQHRLQRYEKERYTWRKIIDILEKHYGNDDLRLIPPLTSLGRSHLYIATIDVSYQQPTSLSSGEVYLKRALRIAENNPEATWQMQESAMLSLGDYYIVSGKPNRARKVYRQTWEFLSADTERLQNRRDHLETLTVIQDANPPRYVGIDGAVRDDLPGENFQKGTMVHEYSVTNRGLITDIEMVESAPPGFANMEQAVYRSLRGMIFRPRLQDGVAVETTALTHTHNFFYRESDLPEQADEADVAATQ